jgi:hypothetical protein
MQAHEHAMRKAVARIAPRAVAGFALDNLSFSQMPTRSSAIIPHEPLWMVPRGTADKA